jgi:hypothetical protein
MRAVGWAFAAVSAVVLPGGCGGVTAGQKCAGPPPVTFGDADPAYLPAKLRACAFDVSCKASRWWWTFDVSQGQAPRSCLVDWNLNGLDGVACAPNATSCDAWLACASHGHCPSWCAAQGLGPNDWSLWTCDGDEVVVCDSTTGYGIPWEDCAQQTMRCQRTNDSAACTDGNACTTPSNPHCEGPRVVGCDSSTLLRQSQDCSGNGGACVPFDYGPLQTAACVSPGAGTPCSASTPARCEGTVAVGCLFGHEVPFDCASPDLQGDCVPLSGGYVTCVPRATECTPETPDSCDGVSFVTCGSNQKLARIDCTSLGFRTCGDIGGRAGCIP